MSEWVRVDPAKFSLSHRENIQGADVELGSSPFDIPIAVRTLSDVSSGTFDIELKYIADEPWVTKELGEHTMLKLGRESHRLLGIEVVVEGLKETGEGSLKGAMSRALKFLDAVSKATVQVENLDVAKKVIRASADKLVKVA
jgi:hypothetical protein